MQEVLQPAIEYAEQGFPVTPTIAKLWDRAYKEFKMVLKGEEFNNWFKIFAPEDRAPRPGEIWRSPNHAKTLRSIAESNGDSFYRGELAQKIDQFSQAYGGFLRKEDLADYQPEWVQPISVHYKGYDVWEIPPNGQGIVALMALNILKGFDFSAKDSADTYHKQIEAMKLAFADGFEYITQADQMTVNVEDLLSDRYAQQRRRVIGEIAQEPFAGEPQAGGTIYLATADGEGNMVSFIQSNYKGFGSGLVVPETGIALHNRGWEFSLDPEHRNCLLPGKKTYHTIIPGFLTKENQPVGPFGVMGGFMQPQGHVQVVMNLIDFHLNPQAALDAPRWQWVKGKTIEVEHSVPKHIVEALAAMGHDVQWAIDSLGFGRGQIIIRDENGVLAGGTEPRTDGQVAVW